MPLRSPVLERGVAGAVLLLLWVSGLAGCRRELSVEEHRVVATVKEYNLLLPRAYLAKKPDLITVGTANELERLTTLIDGLAESGFVLDSRQESLDIGAIRIDQPPLLADVETSETWWYRHVRAIDSSQEEPPKRIRYGLRYKLVQKEGRWLVDRIELLTSEELPAGS